MTQQLPIVAFSHADTGNLITTTRFPAPLEVSQRIVVAGRRYIVVSLGAIENGRQTASIRPWSPVK